MSKKLFTKEDIELLSQNKFIKNITTNGITYTDEFKRIFVNEYNNGKLPKQIFKEYGFDIDILGNDRIHSAAKRWNNLYKINGIEGLSDSRESNAGRPSTKNLSIEEKYARLEAKLNLLKAENELLKKLDMIERKVMKRK